MRLDGKVALVTGASSGIGRETARMLAGEGARVGIAARRKERLEALAEEIGEAGGEALVLPGDAVDPATTDAWVEQTAERFGGLDVLVNAAGIIGHGGGTLDASDEAWRQMLDVNFWSLMRLSRAAVPPLSEGGGSIVNVSSICSYRPVATITSYCVSKAAVDMFTRCFALEVADRQIRVNAINPGVVVSELHTAMGAVDDYEAFLERGKKTHPIGRVGQPEDVGALIAFLASDESSWITGGIFPIDGGRNLMSAR